MRRARRLLAVGAVAACVGSCAVPAPAAAFDPAKAICTLTGLVSTLAGKVCSAAGEAGQLVGLGGTVSRGIGITAIGASIAGLVTEGARVALRAVAAAIFAVTHPNLASTWFSGFYWRMAGVSALLTLPFLFAAAIQALIRSDLTLLLRSAFGYLPLGLLGVSIAAPLTTLLLAASDELSQIVTSASGNADGAFLAKAGILAGALDAARHSAFFGIFVGSFTMAAAVGLLCELLMRAAAVYVIVLMLPLFFAALVWPARRVWAARAVEVLVALILAKFAIVAILALGGAALGHSTVPSATGLLAGGALVLLAAFSPWVLLRLLPLHELAAGAAGGLRAELARQPLNDSLQKATAHHQALEAALAHLHRLMPESPSWSPGADDGADVARLLEPGSGAGAEFASPERPGPGGPASAGGAGGPTGGADELTAPTDDRAAPTAVASPPTDPAGDPASSPDRDPRQDPRGPIFAAGDGRWRHLVLGYEDDLRPVAGDPRSEDGLPLAEDPPPGAGPTLAEDPPLDPHTDPPAA